jgi:hypothetical protein
MEIRSFAAPTIDDCSWRRSYVELLLRSRVGSNAPVDLEASTPPQVWVCVGPVGWSGSGNQRVVNAVKLDFVYEHSLPRSSSLTLLDIGRPGFVTTQRTNSWVAERAHGGERLECRHRSRVDRSSRTNFSRRPPPLQSAPQYGPDRPICAVALARSHSSLTAVPKGFCKLALRRSVRTLRAGE